MKASTPLAKAILEADRTYSRFNLNRDRLNTMLEVRRLAATGLEQKNIAASVGVTAGQVRRILSGQAPEPKAVSIPAYDLSDRHAKQLEHTADIALGLACRLRDEHPQLTWDALNNLDHVDLMKLAVILLAAIPIDRTKSELFAWVYDLPAATENKR